MMENPLNEGYKKIKKGKSWGLENRGGGGEKHERQVKKDLLGDQRILVRF